MLPITVAQETALQARVVRLHHFVRLDLPGEIVNVWDGLGSLVASGETWSGVGEVGIIDGVETDDGSRATNVSLSLVGIPSANLAPGAIEATRGIRYRGRPADISLGIFDLTSGLLIDGLIPLWGGFCDVMSFSFGDTFSATLSAERYDSIMRRTNGARLTTASHNQRLGNPAPADLFFEAQERLMGAARPSLK